MVCCQIKVCFGSKIIHAFFGQLRPKTLYFKLFIHKKNEYWSSLWSNFPFARRYDIRSQSPQVPAGARYLWSILKHLVDMCPQWRLWGLQGAAVRPAGARSEGRSEGRSEDRREDRWCPQWVAQWGPLVPVVRCAVRAAGVRSEGHSEGRWCQQWGLQWWLQWGPLIPAVRATVRAVGARKRAAGARWCTPVRPLVPAGSRCLFGGCMGTCGNWDLMSHLQSEDVTIIYLVPFEIWP